jgi:hypothetical protein
VRELTLAMGAELRGEIEPCGCPTLPYGGFERRRNLLAELEQRDGPLFQLEAGEAFKSGLVHEDLGAAERAVLITELFAQVDLDAFAPGPTELTVLGLEGLRREGSQGLPLVSASWVDEAGAPLFPEARVLEEEGLRLGVVGLSGDSELVASRPPQQALRAGLEALPGDLDLVVVLSNLDERSFLAVDFEGVDLVVATSGSSQDPPRRIDGRIVVEPPPRGRYLTLGSVRLASDRRPLVQLPELGRSYSGLVDLRRVAARLEAEGQDVSAHRERIVSIEAELSRANGRNLVVLDERALGSDLDGASPVTERLARYKAERFEAAGIAIEVVDAELEERFVSSGRCAGCHTRQMARWAATEHAQALRVLRPRQGHQDPECLTCHSTGFGLPGGFAEPSDKKLKTWGAVQCEMCHGPMGGHPSDARVQPRPVTEGTCVGCHDAANSPDFDFSNYYVRTVCPPG